MSSSQNPDSSMDSFSYQYGSFDFAQPVFDPFSQPNQHAWDFPQGLGYNLIDHQSNNHTKVTQANKPGDEVNHLTNAGTGRTSTHVLSSSSGRSSQFIKQSIHQAILSSNLPACRLLISHDPTCVNLVSKDGETCAFLAADGGYINILRLLVKHNIDLNQRTAGGCPSI
ncbi:hypothetical protein QBC41DRAFT_120793 [Cercophora samala]|uniref:Uncharacterized protein n=1 Tax=Cercophora samala TaxID=330535 RepID=A0AA39ZD83_9PEZI|nr:hypothetical protein QBC41DRAFT_120793 [Cercophora samala]